MNPYRDTALAIAPAPYKHSLWMRIKRGVLRWYVTQEWLFLGSGHGSFVYRHPWPCPSCGKRGNAAFVYVDISGPHSTDTRLQKMVDHPCCKERTHIDRPSTYYIPFSRQRHRRECEENGEQFYCNEHACQRATCMHMRQRKNETRI